ncbi:response regulator [Sneathiella sp. P13V-1]|uniref:ATP-binding protein n=1 Tax=Sneathiella sp. P13V-1 TaxID=2697366 RepID=UPI00187B6668|nr:ATP-binding protein [Sneathiella sp. P13V-1]MBE7637306.1 response regulator [Sneathiella sp. P13V-1]
MFSVLTLVTLAILVVTFFSSSLVIDNERQQISGKSGAIADLVLEKRMDASRQFADLIAEEVATKQADNLEEIYSYIEAAFYTQKEGSVDYVALLTEHGDIVEEIHIQLNQFPSIREQISKMRTSRNLWNIAIEPENNRNTAQVLVYYKTELLNKRTGKVDGYILSGLFLNDNVTLLEEIKKRTNADFVSLVVQGFEVSKFGEPKDGISYSSGAAKIVENNKDELFFAPRILEDVFPDSGLVVFVHYHTLGYQPLSNLYVVSAALGFVVIFILSIFAYYIGKSFIVSPIKQLSSYSKRLEKRDKHAPTPKFAAEEFNDLTNNLKSVFTNFIESEKRFQDFASVTSNSMWETDSEHRYTFISRDKNASQPTRYGSLVGLRRWEVEGVDFDYSDWEAHKVEIRDRKHFRNFIFRRVNPVGEMEYWSCSGKPIINERGDFLGYRGTSTNITAEYLAQEEAERIQEQLRQSQKLEVVGQLTGGIAHDFNNLLAVVIGNLELALENESLNASTKKLLNDAFRGAERGASLTHQLLAYSRQQTLTPSVVKPDNIVSGMYSLFTRAVGESISLKTFLENKWSVYIDPNELENALMNLLVNARDAMPEGGDISIESFDVAIEKDFHATGSDIEAGEYVCIVVTDSGSGMSKEIQERIFEPFFTTKEVGKGSGLGLSMVFGFAKQSGGHISIYSEEGVGTSIKLYLPRALQEEEKATKSRDVIRFGNGETVLVIEDDVKVAEMISKQLRSIGYVPDVYVDSEAGILALEKDQADILLVDVIMPGRFSGFDVVEHVKDRYPGLPYVLMSGFTGNNLPTGQKDKVVIENILMKPFSKVQLSEALYVARMQNPVLKKANL